MRILGIDIGSTSIKAVELDSAFGRYEIHEHHELDLKAPGPDATPGSVLIPFLRGLPKQPDKVIAALPTGQVTFRNFQLPTRDKKAIQAGVGFELDDEIPFPIEHAAYDYSVLSQTKQGTYVHVAAALEKNLLAALERWKAAGLDPDVVTTEAWAFRTHLNRALSPADQTYPVMLAQIGHERTNLYVHWNGAPVISHEIRWGGKDLTAAICQKYNLPWDQAEKVKVDNGFVVPPEKLAEVTPEQADFSNTLIEPAMALVAAMHQVELACKNSIHLNIARIYFCGGASRLPGLPNVVESALHIPVSHLQSLSAAAPSGIRYSEQADSLFLTAAGLALSFVGAERATLLNFRKGRFSKQGHVRTLNLKTLRRPIASAAIALGCLFLSLFVESSVYRSQLDEVNTQLERSVRSFFGQVSSSAVRTYMANPSSLRKQITGDLAKQRELARLNEPNPRSPLLFLRDLSTAIPRDAVVDMTQFQVGAAPETGTTGRGAENAATPRASLTFLVANPQIAEKLAVLLGPKIHDMQRGKMEETEIQVPAEIPAAKGGAAAAPEGAERMTTEKRWKVTFTGTPVQD